MIDSFQLNETGEKAPSGPELLDPFYAQLRDQSRFWVQRVAVPCLTLVGLFGNAITIIIMTRRRMRSTTNMYLAALALVDMLYLVLTFLLGLSHYPNVATRRWYAYWRLRPFLMMLTDACSNTSVWLTVTFTIERFIAVKYPIKGKVWCTEARAKRLIVCVFVFGILFASPVPFEWVVKEGKPRGGAPELLAAHARPNTTAPGGTRNAKLEGADLYPVTAAAVAAGGLTGEPRVDNSDDRDWGRLTDDGQGVWDDLSEADSNDGTRSENESKLATEMPASSDEDAEREEYTLTLDYTEFGANETYKTIYYWSTAAIFCFVPLILLTLFNGFLIRSVHSSRRKRNLMTSAHQPQAGQLQRSLSVRDQLRKQGERLGRARLLIRGRNLSTNACKSGANEAIIRSGSPPSATDHPMRQQRATGPRNSIIKLPAPKPGARCSSCAKVTFRQFGRADSQPANDFGALTTGSEFSGSEIVNEQAGESRGHVSLFAPTCDTDAGDDSQLATNCRAGEATLAHAARTRRAQANFVAAIRSDACPPPLLGLEKRGATTERDPRAISDAGGDNKSAKVCGESSRQFKSTLARSKSSIGGVANGRVAGDGGNHFRTHQSSFTPGRGTGGGGGGGSKGAAAGMPTDAGPLRNNSDNGSCATAPASAMPPPPQPPHAAVASSQERRITIMLIAVVILFLVCQIPSAGMLLYTSVHEPKPNTNEHALLRAFGNIFNFLMAVNAAGNFILYSFLSKKYRNTFVTTFCKCAWGRGGGGRGRSQAKSRGNSSGGDRPSTTSQGRASRETSTTQHLVSSYQSTTTTSSGGANSLASSDDATRCSSPASLVRFCKSVRSKARGRAGGAVSTKADMQPPESVQPGDGRPNLL